MFMHLSPGMKGLIHIQYINFQSKAGRIPPEKKRVTAVLLNGRRLDLLSDLGTTGQDLFDLIASHISLNERSYFGLAYIRGESKQLFYFS